MANCYVIGGNGGGITQDDLTAIPVDVVSGYTFGGAGSDDLQTGSMTKRAAMDTTILPGGSATIPAGYHPAGGKVKNSTGLYTAYGRVIPGAADKTLQTSGLILRDGITVPGIRNDLPYIAEDVTLFGQAGQAHRASTYKTLYDGGCRGWWKDGLIDWVDVPTPQYIDKHLYLHWDELTGAHNRRFSPTLLEKELDLHLEDRVDDTYGFFGYKSIDLTGYSKLSVEATSAPTRAGAFTPRQYILLYFVRVSDGAYVRSAAERIEHYSSSDRTVTLDFDQLADYTGEYFVGVGVWFSYSETHDYHDFYGKVTINKITLA